MKTPIRPLLLALLSLLLGAAPAWSDAPDDAYAPPPPQTLAEELFAEGQYAAAAIEFRRLALHAESPSDAATWLWMAANAYAQPADVHAARLASDLLDDVEDAAPPDDPAYPLPIAFLRAELSLRLREPGAARYYFQSIPDAIPPSADPAQADAWREYAARGAAAAALADHDLPAARAAATPYPEALAAVDAYAAVPHKSPLLGGILGIIPGAGYLYSGEYGNAIRSVILNSLFIWAMVETAIEDQWALFGVTTFLETTWYTGSIYGGIDSAHRHNREALDRATAELRPIPPSSVAPSSPALPLLHLVIPL